MTDMRQSLKGDAVARLDGNGDVHELPRRQLPSKSTRRRVCARGDVRTGGCHALALRDRRLEPNPPRQGVFPNEGKRTCDRFLRLCPKSLHPGERVGHGRRRIDADGGSHEEWCPCNRTFDEFAAGCGRFYNDFHNNSNTEHIVCIEAAMSACCVDTTEKTNKTTVSVSTVVAP